MKNTSIKKQNAITLIGLVITIIVLLILAGITISALAGENGLLAKAKMARQAQEESAMNEVLTIAMQDLQVEKLGTATLDDVTQEWIDRKIQDYDCTVTEDASISGKKIRMKSGSIVVKYMLDENLQITELENDGTIEFTYEAKSRTGENIDILIQILSNDSGLKQIECPNGNIIQGNNKKEVGIDYTVELGTEYKFKITTVDGQEKEETVLITDYYQTITKQLSEGITIDNNAIKTAYNKPYTATIAAGDEYILDTLTVIMNGQTVVVDKTTGIINIEKITGDIQIIAVARKLEIQVSVPYIGTSTTEIDSLKSVEDNSQIKGTTKLYINFTAKLEGQTCTIVNKDDSTKTVPYGITEDGTYIFLATGTYNGKTITKEVEITTSKYKTYKIYTPDDLQNMKNDLAGYYMIMQDIDMNGFDFKKIQGTFTGTIDGQGHEISNFTMTNTTSERNYAMFYTIGSGTTIKNLVMENVNIISDNNYYTAVFGGSVTGGTDILFEKVGITGNITGGSGTSSFIGENLWGEIEFNNCYARTTLVNTTSAFDQGGFINIGNGGNIIVNNSYWSGTMTATGRVGIFRGSISAANNENQLTSCASISNSYYNKDLFTLSVPEVANGKGLTTAEMEQSSNYTGWDFTNTWYIGIYGYPELKF